MVIEAGVVAKGSCAVLSFYTKMMSWRCVSGFPRAVEIRVSGRNVFLSYFSPVSAPFAPGLRVPYFVILSI